MKYSDVTLRSGNRWPSGTAATDKRQFLSSLLTTVDALHEIEDSIYSVIPCEASAHSCDTTARFYDGLIGNSLYNRVVWGNWPSAYGAFCEAALNSSSCGAVLDVGCGTLVFTAEHYLVHDARPIVLLDRSLGMLRRAKARLIKLHGGMPAHIVLLQGDATALPFRACSFETVVAWGLLHLFEDRRTVLSQMARAAGGGLFLTSLTKTRRSLANRYPDLLHRSGEMANPVVAQVLVQEMESLGLAPAFRGSGSMAYLSVATGATGKE